jgi:hypothetical protein
VDKLNIQPPSDALMDSYLEEIARAYKVSYKGSTTVTKEPELGFVIVEETPDKAEVEEMMVAEKEDSMDELARRLAALKQR